MRSVTALSAAFLTSAGHKWYCDARRSTVFSAFVFALHTFMLPCSFRSASQSLGVNRLLIRKLGDQSKLPLTRSLLEHQLVPSKPCSRRMNWRSILAAWPYRPLALMGKRKYDMLPFNQTDWWGESLLLEVEFIQFHLLICQESVFFLFFFILLQTFMFDDHPYTHIHTHGHMDSDPHYWLVKKLLWKPAMSSVYHKRSLVAAVSVSELACCGSWDICDALLWFTDTIKKKPAKKKQTNKQKPLFVTQELWLSSVLVVLVLRRDL